MYGVEDSAYVHREADGAASAEARVSVEELGNGSYAVVEDDETKEQITIWCNQYCDKKSQNNNYMTCSLADAASYFKISLKAE